MTEWISKKYPCIVLPTRDSLISKDTHRLTMWRWKKYPMQIVMSRKLVAIHVSDKTDFKKDCNKRQSKMLGIKTKRSIQEEKYNNC